VDTNVPCSVAQAFTDVSKHVYVVKVQQPRGNWAKIYGKAERAFQVLSEYYSLEPHCRGLFKTRNCGLTMGFGSSVCYTAASFCPLAKRGPEASFS
jgi:hypothetical protein